MYYPEGFRREGVWVADKLEGEVRKYMDNETVLEIWLEEGIYEGGAVNQVPHGKGTIRYFETVSRMRNYTGEWSDGVKQGSHLILDSPLKYLILTSPFLPRPFLL